MDEPKTVELRGPMLPADLRVVAAAGVEFIRVPAWTPEGIAMVDFSWSGQRTVDGVEIWTAPTGALH